MKIYLITLLCFLFTVNSYSQQSLMWAQTDGFPQKYDIGKAIVVDSLGNTYQIVHHKEDDNYTNDDYYEIIKRTPDGVILFTIPFSNSQPPLTSGISVSELLLDKNDNIIVGGWIQGTYDFDPSDSVFNLTSNTQDIFYAKYTSNGDLMWAKQIYSSSGDDFITKIVQDDNNNFYITGSYTHDYPIGQGFSGPTFGYIVIYPAGGEDMFISKFNENGVCLWAKGIGSENDENPSDMVLDSLGNIYLVGRFEGDDNTGNLDLNPATGINNIVNSRTDATTYDLFIAKYTNNGEYIAAYSAGNIKDEYPKKLFIYENKLYFTGEHSDTIDLDFSNQQFLLSTPDFSQFIAKFNTDLSLVWAKNVDYRITINDIDFNNGIAYTTGRFSNTVDFDFSVNSAFSITAYGSSDFFIGKYSTDFDLIGVKTIGNSKYDVGNSISVDDNYIYITGYYSGTVDFDYSSAIYNLTSQDVGLPTTHDAFIAKYNKSTISSLDENIPNVQFQIYPNPTSQILSIFNDNMLNFNKATVSITDIVGKQYKTPPIVMGNMKIEIDIAGLNAGIYIVTIQKDNETYRTKFIKV